MTKNKSGQLTKYGRRRDSQRSRVYDAEEKMFGNAPVQTNGGRLETVDEIKSWVDQIRGSRWFKNRFPYIQRIVIKDGRGTRDGFGDVLASSWELSGIPRTRRKVVTGYLNLPKWSRSRLVILHELAHVCATAEFIMSRYRNDRDPIAAHGPEYCGYYLALVDRFLGRLWRDELRASMREHRVKIGPMPKPFRGGSK